MYRMLTVEHAHRTDTGLQLEPKVKLKWLIAEHPGRPMLMRGQEVELRFPDGNSRTAYVSGFGIEAWLRDGRLYTYSNPADVSLTLTLAGDLRPEDVPSGTEIWRRESTEITARA
jgi:hypothetical protein